MSGRSGRATSALIVGLLSLASLGLAPSAATQEQTVVYVHAVSTDAADHAATAAGLDVLERWDRVGIVVARGPAAAIAAVGLDPAVARVEHPQPIVHYGQSVHRATRLEQAIDPVSELLTDDDQPFDGSGVVIAVIDQGLDVEHPMFVEPGKRKVLRNLRFDTCELQERCDHWIEDPPHHLDRNFGHGTAVSSIAVGYERVAPDGLTVRGVAPGAQLVALNSIGLDPWGYPSALNWLLENHADPCGDGTCPAVRVVSISWGNVSGRYDPEDAISRLVTELVQDGVVVTAAVANSGGDGSRDLTGSVGKIPAPGVIGVANYGDNSSGTREAALSTSSSRGQRDEPSTWPDVSAPGSMRVASPGGGYNDSSDGTSNAAPYVAGLAALLIQADPSLTPAEIELLVEETAHEFGGRTYVPDPAHPGGLSSFDRGHGLVDVTRALARLLDAGEPSVRPCGAPTSLSSPVNLSVHPSADVTELHVRGTPAGIEFEMRVRDLMPPSRTNPVDTAQIRFVLLNEHLEIRLTRDMLERRTADLLRYRTPWTPAYDQAPLPLVSDLPVAYDEAGGRVVVALPYGALHAADPSFPGESATDHVTLTQVLTRSGASGDNVSGAGACSVRLGS